MSEHAYQIQRTICKFEVLFSSQQFSNCFLFAKIPLYLVHQRGFLSVRFPFDSLVTVLDGVALHIHFRGQRLATLCYNRCYLLDFEQIDLEQVLQSFLCLCFLICKMEIKNKYSLYLIGWLRPLKRLTSLTHRMHFIHICYYFFTCESFF